MSSPGDFPVDACINRVTCYRRFTYSESMFKMVKSGMATVASALSVTSATTLLSSNVGPKETGNTAILSSVELARPQLVITADISQAEGTSVFQVIWEVNRKEGQNETQDFRYIS